MRLIIQYKLPALHIIVYDRNGIAKKKPSHDGLNALFFYQFSLINYL